MEDDATISVRDFGPGVPDKSLTRIFDLFFRVEEARNTNGEDRDLAFDRKTRRAFAPRLNLGRKRNPWVACHDCDSVDS